MPATTTIIKASAGSGKTYRLAVAYLRALLLPQEDGTPVPPSQVLATTFTRAAASEILERVLRRLAQAVVSAEDRARLLEELGRPDLNKDDLSALLASVCQSLPQLQIGTIDALFSRMVRVLGLDLAFPPAWTVADETLAAELALQAADLMLRGSEARVSLEQWRRYAQFRTGLRVRATLVDLLEENRFHLVESETGEDDPALPPPQQLTREEAEALVQALDHFDGWPRTKAGKPDVRWVKAVDKTKTLFVAEAALISLLGDTLLRRSLRDGERFQGSAVPPSLRDILGPVAVRAIDDLSRLHRARLAALSALARRYHDFRRRVAYASAAYRFPEVESAARLLPPHLTREDLYFRLDGQVRHLLLDEFQDTSLGQFRFLWPVIEEIVASGRLFLAVGDVKQSIYGWRGADRRLLNRLPGWLRERDPHLEELPLADNFRSSPAVLQAVDRVFRRLDQLSCLEPVSYKTDDAQNRARRCQRAATSFIADYATPQPAGDNRFLPGRVRLLVTGQPDADVEEEEDEDFAPNEISMILTAVEEHRREDPQREIAILCRRRKWIPGLIAGLRRRGIDASGEGGSTVADSAAVEMVLSMLTWVDHPGHTLARQHIALGGCAEVFGLTGGKVDPYLPKRLQTDIMRQGLAPTVADWVRHVAFVARCTAHDRVRCEQLVELARQWDTTGGGRLSAFVKRARSQPKENPIAARVRVMTIHAAKGLEFETVILADLQSRSGRRPDPSFAITLRGPGEPPGLELLPAAKYAEALGLQEACDRAREEDFEEDLSVLYVALTRAKSYLDVVLTAASDLKPTLAGILGEAWGHTETGRYLIESNPAIGPSRPRASVPVMTPDGGIWQPALGFRPSAFAHVPPRLAAATPSGREGAGIINLAQLFGMGGSQALERGTAVHALLSRVEWRESLLPPGEWSDSIPAREADSAACRLAAQELHPRLLVASDPLSLVFDSSRWLDLWRGYDVKHLEVWRERRFAVVLGTELMNGSFDRVVLGLDAIGRVCRATILDFKTDRVTDGPEREERARYYQPQLDAYALALEKLTGLPADAITTQLVWIN